MQYSVLFEMYLGRQTHFEWQGISSKLLIVEHKVASSNLANDIFFSLIFFDKCIPSFTNYEKINEIIKNYYYGNVFSTKNFVFVCFHIFWRKIVFPLLLKSFIKNSSLRVERRKRGNGVKFVVRGRR